MNKLRAARPFAPVPNCPGVTYDEYNECYATVGPRPTMGEIEEFDRDCDKELARLKQRLKYLEEKINDDN